MSVVLLLLFRMHTHTVFVVSVCWYLCSCVRVLRERRGYCQISGVDCAGAFVRALTMRFNEFVRFVKTSGLVIVLVSCPLVLAARVLLPPL